MTRRPNALGLEDAAIAQQRIEDAGEATGEGDHGHRFSRGARRCAGSRSAAAPPAAGGGGESWGSLCHHVKREAAGFIPSTLCSARAARAE
jgi:hypothetical protein